MVYEDFPWTKNQKLIFDLNKKKNGKFVVKACPGSGKTTCISKRLVDFVEEYTEKRVGIATLSFTNVALNEIEENYKKFSHGKTILYPHYIGTIDSFINNYIFLPFGHLVMHCKCRPKLVGEPYNYWSSNSYSDNFFDRLSFSIDGNIIKIKSIYDCPKDKKSINKIFKKKHYLNRQGYAIQSDSNYFAMKVLQKYPNIAKLLSSRFPYIIIDEAQDTSDIQMAIFDLLLKNGLDNMILVGDPEQAIFEWNNANPELFEEKFSKWGKESIKLTDNFRCTQKIAYTISKMSKNHFFGRNKTGLNESPEIWSYEQDDFKFIINQFLQDCSKKNIKVSKENVAVLFRSNSEISNFLFKLNEDLPTFKDEDFWSSKDYFKRSYTKNVIYGKYYWENKDLINGFKNIQNALYLKKDYKTFCVDFDFINEKISKEGFCNYRSQILKFINLLPNFKLSDNVEDWIIKSNKILNNNGHKELNPIKEKRGIKNFKNVFTFQMMFNNKNKSENLNYYLGNIHSVKGRSFDAVLLILTNRQNNFYKNIFNNELKDNEELRIIYVALTRAKYILRIGVHKKDKILLENYFHLKQSSLFDF